MAFGVAVFLALTWGIWQAQSILTRDSTFVLDGVFALSDLGLGGSCRF
jgi:hypothetical protein